MQPLDVLARIKIPAEAIVPMLIGLVALLVLIFAGAALADWKVRNPKPAKITGLVFAIGLTGFALFKLIMVVPQTDENDPIHEGVYNVTLFDGPILGFCALVAVIMWGYAGMRKVALGFGLAVAAAMIAKPLVWPMFHHYTSSTSDYKGHLRDFTDLEHLGFTGPAIAVLIAALVVGLGRDRAPVRRMPYPQPPYPPPPQPPQPPYPPPPYPPN
jgi:hypothetical protein